MKKKYLLVFASLFLVGCGETADPVPAYEVKVVYPDGTPVNGGVSVEWCTSATCSQSIVVNENGIASTTELEDDTYTVHIGNIPEGYAYDPNAYVVDENNRSVTITLSNILTYEDGDGSKYASGEELGPYIIKEGVYNVRLTNDNSYSYFAFMPSNPGKYIIESWSLTKDTLIEYYGNNPHSINNTPIDNNDNDGGENNFKYTIDISSENYGSQNSGYTMIFGITVNSKNKNAEFPINVKCLEKYDFGTGGGDISNNQVTNKEQPVLYEAPSDSKLTSMPFDGSLDVVFNQNDKFYHVGEENGPVLLAHFSSLNDYIVSPIATIQGENSSALVINELDYNPLVSAYNDYVNSDGVCPVNQELRDFINVLVNGPIGEFLSGWLEVDVDKENFWLVYCSYYNSIYEKLTSNELVIDNSLTYGEVTNYYAVEVNESSSVNLTIPYVENGINEYTIVSENPNAKLNYNGQDYSSDKGFNVVVKNEGSQDIEFTISTVDNASDTINFKVGLGDLNITRAIIGNNLTSVDNNGKYALLVASETCIYRFNASKGSNVILVINDNEYSSEENDINVEVKLNVGDTLKYMVKNINSSVSNLTYKISKVYEASVGSNDIMFEELSLITGVEMKLVVPANGKYAFRVDAYCAETFSLSINGTNYKPNSDGLINVMELALGDVVSLLAKNNSFESSYISLYIEELNGEIGVGENSILVKEDYLNGACVMFTAPEEGTYVISTSSCAGTVGGKLQYGDDITGVANRDEMASLMPISLKQGQQIIVYVMYEQTNWETGITPAEYNVVVNVSKTN